MQTEALADIHRRTEGMNLDNVFCYKTKRQVRNDYTIIIKGNYIQLEKSKTIFKILSFLVLGAALVIISVVYTRNRNKSSKPKESES